MVVALEHPALLPVANMFCSRSTHSPTVARDRYVGLRGGNKKIYLKGRLEGPSGVLHSSESMMQCFFG